MGTNITFFVEQRLDNGSWELAEQPVKNPFFQPNDPDFDAEPSLIPKLIDLNRNYSLFAILANERNGSHAEDYFNPISEPREIPEDISKIGLDYYRYFGKGCWNASWLTPAEIENFNWSQVIQRQAFVVPEVAQLFKDNPMGFPFKRWPENIPISYSEFSKNGQSVRWRETYEQAGDYDSFKDELASYLGSDLYRFVFWFSS